MRCEAAQREVSARLDAAPDRALDERVDGHLATCSRCRAYEGGARRLRELVRIEPAAPVPDLVPRIMEQVRWRDRRPLVVPPEWRRVAAAFAAAALAAALVVGGLPGLRRGPRPALATEIPRLVAEASTGVTEYRATFDVLERNFHEEVPVRRFVARIAFVAPERFRARVTDRTAYPSERWPRNDLRLEVDEDRWLLASSATCPREALPACTPGGRVVRAVRGREPFDADALLPTDIVLPVRTLAGTERVRVVGEGAVLGRPAVTVGLAYRDATPLFAYLQEGGLWRPLFPLDRVLVSLDRETWFPLAYEVRPSDSPQRDEWALRHGLPPEPPEEAIFSAAARSFRSEAGLGSAPVQALPGVTARDHGFRDIGFSEVARAAESDPLIPSVLKGLRPYRAGIFASAERPADEVLLSFTRGLAWLKVRQTRAWSEPALYGDVGALAAPIGLEGGGVAYYEPASASLGRRLSIHASGIDVYLETNLPLPDLLEIAASIPVRGVAAPEDWLTRRWPGGVVREQVPLEEALEAVPDLLLPLDLPAGYEIGTISLVEASGRTGVTVYLRRPGAEMEGVGIRVHQAAATALPPPMDPDVLSVRVRGVMGRYTPGRGELEWVEGGVYHSLRAAGLDLVGLLSLAESLDEARLALREES